MKLILSILGFFLFCQVNIAQIVSLSPVGAGPDDEITLTFDASQGNGELVGESKIYMHHGIVLSGPDGMDWNYVIGNWGQDDGVGEMTKVDGESDLWEITFSPSLRAYFGASASDEIFRITAVFRSADGSKKGTTPAGDYGWGTVSSGLDYFINLNNANFLSLLSPTGDHRFINAGESINIEAKASGEVSDMQISIDEGAGFEEKANVNSGVDISYAYFPSTSSDITIKITANVNGEALELISDYTVIIKKDTEIFDMPDGLKRGINYHADDSKATLVLEAPNKEFVFVVGDFTNWKLNPDFQMNRTPDGELYWLEIENLEPETSYVFQYWVDGEIKVGDPYADQVADPWNDKWISEDVYPNLPAYDKTDYSVASVLQTAQTPYTWSNNEDEWVRPDINHLVIYELHIRDFLASHHYQDLIDTLAYLKNLGVEAIELMPVSEFEGNDSWGYNPSYYFAPDKYYGTKDDLKAFIDAAHKEGLAVILDMVLNHAYGENPMVRMYFNSSTGKPSADNPWFNVDHVGPYSWGYDFNHESDYTKAFIDRVNKYWIEEYHFDGFRFDFTKGFTNNAPGGSIDNFDQSRIDILKRMADEIWKVDDQAYVILEHWSPASEENVLSAYGMKLWRNKSYDFVPVTVGNVTGNFNGADATSHVSFFDSHDERRIAEHCLTEGSSTGAYNIKSPIIMYERVKMAAAFNFLLPGPKMMWQFDELAYDIDINFNGRVGVKPLPWGDGSLEYYEDPLRKYVYDTYAAILQLRKTIGPDQLLASTKEHKLSGNTRRLSYNTNSIDFVLVANFALNEESIDPAFTETGTWYDYFSGEEISVTDLNATMSLGIGEWHIYTNQKISDGFPSVVEFFQNPVDITPAKFTINDEITIQFDAKKASKFGTDGLVGAESVYIHAGLILDDPNSTTWSNTVGTLSDDGLGKMTSIGNDKWEIKIKPSDYFGVNEDADVYKLVMYFRDATNENIGKGFRDLDVYWNVEEDGPFVWVDPNPYQATDLITVKFNARKGNAELLDAGKIYMHSSVGIIDTNNPQGSAWNNAVGNWGQDDGVGEMSKVPGTDNIWQINLTPKEYYSLADGEHPYWLACVFRNADGSVKGTGSPGEIEGGFIDSSLDFFLQNQGPDAVINQEAIQFEMYPNPAFDRVVIKKEGEFSVRLSSLDGQVLLHENATNQSSLDVTNLSPGLYFISIQSGNKISTRKFTKI